MRRHDIVFVSPAGWRSWLATRPDLASDLLVAGWVDRGWPLVRRRELPGEAEGIPLGLPLPPFAGKRRLPLVMRRADVVSTSGPPTLDAARKAAPHAWRPTLDAVTELAARHVIEARVFGSLAWRVLTGLDYLTDRSDLDLLLPVHGATDLSRLTDDLARIEAQAPMRLDGELILGEGTAVSWREFHSGAREILAKTSSSVALIGRDAFQDADAPP